MNGHEHHDGVTTVSLENRCSAVQNSWNSCSAQGNEICAKNDLKSFKEKIKRVLPFLDLDFWFILKFNEA